MTPQHRCVPPPRETSSVNLESHGRKGWCGLTLSLNGHFPGRSIWSAPWPTQPAPAQY